MRKSIFIFIVLLPSLCVGKNIATGKILNTTSLKAGLIVHVGCEDGRLTVPPGADGHFIIQELSEEVGVIAAAREDLKSTGKHGKETFETFDGTNLPYVENIVNLLVISSPGNLSKDEIMRVLVPGGSVVIKNGKNIPGLKTTTIEKLDGWKEAKKTWPENIDEWTHYLHDSGGSSVSDDLVVGEPNGLRWTCGPFWARSHEHTASMNAMVTAAGKIFYVMDEGPTESIQLPSKNFLTARDAFNGILLWKRPIHDWFNHLFPLKSGPGWLPRRLVAVKDRVFLAPGVGQNLLCLDASTGKVLNNYKKTADTFELVVSDGVIFAAVDPNDKPCDYNQENANCWKERDRANNLWGWNRKTGIRIIKALDVESGKLLWKQKMPVAPMTLSADLKMVCLYDGSEVIALDRHTGKELWKTEVTKMDHIGTGYAGPRLIICENRIVFASLKQIFVLNPATGALIWSLNNKPSSGHYSLEDFYVIGDKIWAMEHRNNGRFTTYNLTDGEKLKEYSNPINSFYIHQRCYDGRATKRCLLPPIMGTTIYDMKTGKWSIDDWVRGGCIYGSMPANGMIYTGPNACACYYQSKLNGFLAVVPDPQPSEAPPAEKRLVKGPAYGICDQKAKYPASAWPTFRHDNTRSSYVKTDVGATIKKAWEKIFNTKVSQPVSAGGKIFLSLIDEHTVYALDALSGDEKWHFIAGGRVNSAPTIYRGLALFGCADGWIYALNAIDGKLAWKFQAAPSSRKLISYGQLESVWPLAGNVLIQDGKLYTVAGRSMFLDGGLRMIVLAPETGKLLHENVMDKNVPGTNKNLQDILMGKHMPVAMPDVLSGDGHYIYMKSQTFTADGKRLRIKPQRPDTQYDQEIHLFSPVSFLDDSWHQRTYWIYGRAAGEGWAEFQLPAKRIPYGRIMCLDEKNAYSYARDPELLCNASVCEYRLYSAGKLPKRKVGIPRLEGTRWPKSKYPTKKKDRLAPNSVDWKQLAKLPMKKLTALEYNWIKEEPEIITKAMVLANNHLFIAGPRDVVDEKSFWGRSNEKIFNDKMEQQAEWLNGKYGSFMQVFSKKDGKKIAEYKLDCLPAFDGLIAAEGRLYMATRQGSVICYAPTKQQQAKVNKVE